ncbi:ABC transporter substrate-binding protein (plasmid) [Rhizobium sp. CB3090]|uniref:ABC transporter substrate-binding protein n=1 Tax=Rhizobium sp. CB3090 TaxID=3039156 RepID=UPI0024B22316|nr:ABC transporter substrate-binding protein [Rhizobium sp. CB3090]WFU12880.1 ABC transporter substrate-binding protein [Rhizobium sp. CB3090]
MKKLLLTTAFIACMAPITALAKDKAEVIHWWTSGGESKAISVIADAFKAEGGDWVDRAVAGGEAARLDAINAINGGQAPDMAQFNTSNQFRELIDGGLLANLDSVAAAQDWDKVLPAPIRDVIKVDGHYYAAPVNVHNPAWIWYSKTAFEKAKIAGEPKTREEFFAALEALKASGVTPLALGGQPWQERLTFDAVLLHFGGKDLYLKFLGAEGATTVDTPEFRQVLADFKRLKNYIDAGSPNRNWNEATAMVINATAGVQIMGDWAKGEFSAAGEHAGIDFGCIPGFGSHPSYMIAGDVFIFPKLDDEQRSATQKRLATLMLSPKVQIDFNTLKGSIPARTDVDGKTMDSCAQIGMKIAADPNRQVPNPEMLLPPDIQGSVNDVISNFWNTNQTVDEAVAALRAALAR